MLPVPSLPRRTTLRLRSVVVALLAAGAIPAQPALAQQGPPPEVRETVDALMTYLETGSEAVARRLLSERATPAFVDGFDSEQAALDHLAALHAAARGGTGGLDITPGPDGLVVALENDVRILLDLDDAGRVLRLERLADAESDGATVPAPTWDGLDAWFRRLEEDGFSGVVYARRGGDEVLRSAYGSARRDGGMPNTTELAFGIGSAPIGFTIVAAAALAATGELDLDAPLSRYLDDVPADRAAMTPRMIMEGRSGLPDFHDTPADWDPDLAWIDRDEALGRIMQAPLLFAPGTEAAHSHSAYGLLAAVLEIVSGQSYEALLQERIFEPLGMEHTGFYGQTLGMSHDRFAEGRGVSSVGAPNIPPNWGPTSWLVQGSGGMFSTLDDRLRFLDGWRSGEVFPSGADVDFAPSPVTVDGSDRGFFGVRAMNDEGDLVLLMANDVRDVPGGERTLIQGIVELVRGG